MSNTQNTNPPKSDNHLMIESCLVFHWKDLEAGWRAIAAPHKAHMVSELLIATQILSAKVGPEKIIYNILHATAWLNDDRSDEDLVSGSGLKDG